MTRSLCAFAVLGVAAVPDWASAYHPCWAPPLPCGYGYGYAVPVYPVYPLPAYPPVAAIPARPAPARAPLAPPTIAPAAAAPKAAPRDEPAAIPPAFADPRPAPAPEAVRPAAATEPAPTRPQTPPPFKPAASDLLPSPGLPVAPPVTLPPASPAADAKKPEALPPLVLPPDVPGGPSGVVPGSVSRFRPAGGPLVEVLAVEGEPKAAGTRKVGFFNHTGKPIELVVDGRPVTLPRKSYLHAEVPPAFKWRYNGNPAEAVTVPEDAAGLDVVFRE